MIYYTKDNYVYTHFIEGGEKTTIKDVADIDCRMVTLTGNRLIKSAVKPRPLGLGDIRCEN